ncbi:MAG: aldo/keto reductase [Desulfobacterales bacterium]|jgi:aryl-alcohol dehydrogenase-like predicted oxidoreductase
MNHKPIETRNFGSTLQEVTRTGLGGEGVLRTHGRIEDASEVIREAIDQGINYFDCARVYADSELYYGYVWKENPEIRAKIFQASKSASRDRTQALADLEQTLERLQTDYLDLWQIHDVRTPQDLAMISAPGGALEAFVEAKSDGKVRFIGVTGHHDPKILTQAVRSWPVDAVMMPVNPVEGILGGFLTETLPAARKKNLAVIGMKVLGAAHYLLPESRITAATLIRHALSFDIDVAIVGCATPAEVKCLAETGRRDRPLPEKERDYLISVFKPIARRLAYYRGVID